VGTVVDETVRFHAEDLKITIVGAVAVQACVGE
jgi:hypothetical protein